jgi:hypothetical protein
MHLKAGVLLNKLSVTLLNVLDGVVLGLHLADVLLQAEALVGASCRDLLKQEAHMLGVVCRERPTCVVSQKLGVTNGGHTVSPYHVALILNRDQGNDGTVEDQQVALIELREGLVGSPLQSVITLSCGELSHHGRIRGMSQDVHVDPTTSTHKLTVRATTIRESPRVAKVVQHVPEQGGKAKAVGSEGGVGVVVHLSKTREK